MYSGLASSSRLTRNVGRDSCSSSSCCYCLTKIDDCGYFPGYLLCSAGSAGGLLLLLYFIHFPLFLSYSSLSLRLVLLLSHTVPGSIKTWMEKSLMVSNRKGPPRLKKRCENASKLKNYFTTVTLFNSLDRSQDTQCSQRHKNTRGGD